MDNFNVSNFNINNQPKKSSIPKIIFIILGVALIIELVYAGWSLFPKSISTPLSVTQTSEQSIAGITLTTSKQSFRVGEIVPVSVMIDAGSKTISGVDLIIQYDPKILEVTKEDLIPGRVMDEYPLRSVDPNKGLVAVSGISSLGNGFSGAGEFAILNFKAKTQGRASLVINFEKGSTVASNLVKADTSENILEKVNNLEVTIE
ncbi:MAG: cohesin domain-containing protein [Candidatus Daviesbacteria bacterium]|nr:cohesin domain-containing protein [Candidatus Daviesbacteria bacterium]